MSPHLLLDGEPTPADSDALRTADVRAEGTPGPHWIDVNALCRRLVERVTPLARRRGVEVDLSLAPGETTVIGFAPALAQALEMLVANALDEMPEGGTLSLRACRDPYVILECCSQPAGPAPGQLAHNGHAAGSSRSADRAASARAVIEAHRGHLWLRPLTPRGSCAIVELPAAGPGQPDRPWRR